MAFLLIWLPSLTVSTLCLEAWVKYRKLGHNPRELMFWLSLLLLHIFQGRFAILIADILLQMFTKLHARQYRHVALFNDDTINIRAIFVAIMCTGYLHHCLWSMALPYVRLWIVAIDITSSSNSVWHVLTAIMFVAPYTTNKDGSMPSKKDCLVVGLALGVGLLADAL
jgi:hypothetical protein